MQGPVGRTGAGLALQRDDGSHAHAPGNLDSFLGTLRDHIHRSAERVVAAAEKNKAKKPIRRVLYAQYRGIS